GRQGRAVLAEPLDDARTGLRDDLDRHRDDCCAEDGEQDDHDGQRGEHVQLTSVGVGTAATTAVAPSMRMTWTSTSGSNLAERSAARADQISPPSRIRPSWWSTASTTVAVRPIW